MNTAAWIILIGIIIVLEFVGMVIFFAVKFPYAGNVVIDIRRDSDDSLYIESPKNLNNWKRYKTLRFDVEIKQDFTRDGSRPDDPNYTGQSLNNMGL